MEIKDLKPGKHLEITVQRGKFLHHLNSWIEVARGPVVCVSLIIGQSGQPFRFYPEDKITLTYRLEDRLWKWNNANARVGVMGEEKVHVFTVRNPVGESFNRRQVYRVYMGEEIDFTRRVPDIEAIRVYRKNHPEIRDIGQLEEIDECFKTMPAHGVVKDISETGVGLYSREKILENEEIQISLPTKFGTIECVCKTVRSEVDATSRYQYFYGCRILFVGSDIATILARLQRYQLSVKHNRAKMNADTK